MWNETQPPQYCSNWKYYKNHDLPAEKIIGIAIEGDNATNYDGKNVRRIMIRFANTQLAKEFCITFTELCPEYLEGIDALCATYHYDSFSEDKIHPDIEFELLRQKLSDLEKVCVFLRDECNVPQEILQIIVANPRKLSDLEQEFYKTLPEINKEIFPKLLGMAKEIVAVNKQLDLYRSCNQQANALWELAMACREAEPILLEEWEETLKCIGEKTNCLFKAHNLLLHHTLAKLDDISGYSLEQQKQLFKEGFEYIDEGLEEGEESDYIIKMALSFLGINWQDKPQFFPTSYNSDDFRDFLIDTFFFAKSLKTQNKLLQEQNLQLQSVLEKYTNEKHTNEEGSSSSQYSPRPKF